MKYGLTLFCDERAEFKADQIALVDRVLESFDDVSQLRSRSVCARNTNDMLQVVRSSYSDIQEWCQFFIKQDKPVYAYVLCGLSELKGGGSQYWNERHLECLIVELLAYGFDVVLVNVKPNPKTMNEAQSKWLGIYIGQCRQLATKYNCDTLTIRIKTDIHHSAVSIISQRIAKDLKDRYADTVVGGPVINSDEPIVDKSVDKSVDNSKPKRRLRQMIEQNEERKKANKPPISSQDNIDRQQLQQLAKLEEQADTKPPKPPKKRTRKPKASSVKIERF